jgi:TonB family protein
MVLPGYSLKHKPKKEEDNATAKLKWALEQFQKGESLYTDKKIDDAITEYRKALKTDPQEPYWHQALGKALQQKGDLHGALAEYSTASQQSPLDSGLRSKYEELATVLHVGVEPGSVTPAPPKTALYSSGPLKPGEQATAPFPTYKPEPAYSDKARAAKYSGTTTLWLVVDADGNVTDTRVDKPLGLGLDEQALETVRTWKFKPATRGGVPVPVRVEVEINFKLF